MTGNTAEQLAIAAPTQSVMAPSYCTGFGQRDTHAAKLNDGRPNPSNSAGTPYGTITGAEIAAMVNNPPSTAKEQSQWFIPSSHAGPGGRSHEEQRQNGAFYWLTLDVDENNLALDAVLEALTSVLGPCSSLIYSTRSATPDNRKWRALVRLEEPLVGADYADTQAAFFDLLEDHTTGVLICDRALERPGQLVYLPNKGAFYKSHIERQTQLQLTIAHPVIRHRDGKRAARQQAEVEATAARELRVAQRAAQGVSEGVSVVEHFNAKHAITDLLERYGYHRAGQGKDYRSPMQSTGSHATRDYGDYWISLSGSDSAAEIGFQTASGCSGDAFDLFVHFEHDGKFREAIKLYAEEAGIEREDEPNPFANWPGIHGSEGAQPVESAPVAATGGSGEHENPMQKDDTHKRMDWPQPSQCLLRPEIPKPPALPLNDVLRPQAADWVAATAEASGAPADYVLSALLSAVGGIVGNSRWVSPWRGWVEPPIIWSMCVGLPSAGKSPAIESVLSGVRRVEKPMRTRANVELEEWNKQQKIAKIAEQAWEAKCRKAIEKGLEPPAMSDEADAGKPPHIPRLIINDGTVERIGVIAEAQPKGVLQVRDELSGWLLTMESRNGGADRAFWLEAYGGRSFTVERMGRTPLTIERLTIGALGGIQPDKLNELLVRASDDGLVARFMPTWPAPAPVSRPTRFAEDGIADAAWSRLAALQMPTDEEGDARSSFAQFDEQAAGLMDEWRLQCREWEAGAEGLLLSHIGKMPGLAARLALVFASIDYAFDREPEPNQITGDEFGRACHYIETYGLPMAKRCYASASIPKAERAAKRLLGIIKEERWYSFTTRQVMRHDRASLGSKASLDPALVVLLEGDCIRYGPPPKGEPLGGRPVKAFDVNPAIFEVQS